jgi:flagellar basal body-associated protein FliL
MSAGAKAGANRRLLLLLILIGVALFLGSILFIMSRASS